MTDRYFFGVLVALALAAGALVVVVVVGNSPAVVDAAADLQRARAAQEWARVDAERARSAQAWADTAAARAWSVTSAQYARTFSDNAPLFAFVALVAVAVLAVGAAVAGASWSVRRARQLIVYPRAGVSPVVALEYGGALHVVDTGRALGSVTTIQPGGAVALPLAAAPELHAELSGHAIVGAVVAGVAGQDQKAQAAARVGEAVADAMATLPAFSLSQSSPRTAAPVFVDTRPDNGGELRVIRRGPPAGERGKPYVPARAHVAEYITRGAVAGFGRREWAGHVFQDGARLSQTHWAILSQTVKDAGVLVADGPRWKLRGSVDEALDTLGLADLVADSA